jgi:hypothetical protein
MPSANPLFDRFSNLQRELRASLESAATHRHPVAAGDSSELNWLEMLREHLPTRYSVDRAFVLDSTGAQSRQLDVVIYDRQYSFRIFNRAGQLYLPAESVYAVFEVKTSLSSRWLRDAGEKVASVRGLLRTRAVIAHAGGTVEKPQLKPLPWILGGLLCSRTSSRDAFGPRFRQALEALPEIERLELGCVADRGTWSAHEAGAPEVEVQQGELPLARFLLTLLRRLQPIGTVPAIDFRRYEGGLEGTAVE